VDPVQQYAMIDNASGGRRAARWPSTVPTSPTCGPLQPGGAGKSDAAFPDPMDAEQIATPSAANRPLAFPYNKWHSTQWTVNQSAALVLCSAEAAARLAVPTDRWVFRWWASNPVMPSHSCAGVSPTPGRPWRYSAGRRRTDRPVPGRVEVVEAYSCFPRRCGSNSVPWGSEPTRRRPSPGMAFAGGPFNNFVLQATAAVARTVRDRAGSLGAVTTVSGLLTKPGIGSGRNGRTVWPPRRRPRRERGPDTGLRRRGRRRVARRLPGSATVVTYT